MTGNESNNHGEEYRAVEEIINSEAEETEQSLPLTCEECGHDLFWFERSIYVPELDEERDFFKATCQYCGMAYRVPIY